MSKNFNGYLLALFAIFFWSFNVIYSKFLSNTFTPFEISFIRWLIPSVTFLPFVYKTIWANRHIYRKFAPYILIISLTGLGFQNTFVYFAGHTSNAIDMALIGTIGPIILLIFSALFLHKKIHIHQVLGILCAVGGVTIVILNGNLTNINNITLTIGDLWMLCAAFSFAIYSIARKKLPQDLPAIPTFTLNICISTIIFFPLAAYDFKTEPHTIITKTDVLILIILAIFNSGIAYLSWNKALTLIGTVKSGTLYYLMPILSTIEAHFFLNEEIYTNQIYGALFVLLGIFISNINLSSQKNLHHHQPNK